MRSAAGRGRAHERENVICRLSVSARARVWGNDIELFLCIASSRFRAHAYLPWTNARAGGDALDERSRIVVVRWCAGQVMCALN